MAASSLYSISSSAYAPAEGNITSYFGPYLYQTNFKASETGALSPVRGGIGLVVNGDINYTRSLEIGIFQINKNYFREESGKFINEQTPLVHITMGHRWWLSDYFSTSLSFFSGYSMEEPQIIHSDFPIGSEIDTSARDTTEYGFDFAVQAELLNRINYAIVLDARYSLSVTNKKNENADHYGIMLGLRYTMREKKY